MDKAVGIKNDQGKTPYDLLSPWFLEGTAQVLAFGVKTYAPYNWALGILFSRVFAALQRHLWAWQAGEERDEESGMPHLWHASCCLMFLVHYTSHTGQYEAFDDRFGYEEADRRTP